jgi:hypothetical protein
MEPQSFHLYISPRSQITVYKNQAAAEAAAAAALFYEV